MEVEAEFGDQVLFVGVPGLSNDDASKAAFLDETGANTFPNLLAGDAVWEHFGVRQQRTYVYLNDDGTFEQAPYGNLREDVQALIAS